MSTEAPTIEAPQETPMAIVDTGKPPMPQVNFSESRESRYKAYAERSKASNEGREIPGLEDASSGQTQDVFNNNPNGDKAPESTPEPKPTHGNAVNREESNKALRQKLEAETKAKEEVSAKHKELEDRIAELQQKEEMWSLTTKERDELKSKYDDVQKHRDEQEQKLAYYNITQSTAYENEIKKPLENIWKSVDEIVAAHKLDGQTFERALQETDRAKRSQMLEDLMADIPSVDRTELMDAYRGIRSLWDKGRSMQENAVEKFHAIQEKEKQELSERSAKQKDTFLKAADAVAKGFLDKKHDQGSVEKALSEVKGMDWDNLPPDVKTMALMSMHLLVDEKPVMQSKIEAQEAKIKELEAALSRYNTKPGPGSSQVNNPVIHQTDTKKGESAEDKESRYKSWGHFGRGR